MEPIIGWRAWIVFLPQETPLTTRYKPAGMSEHGLYPLFPHGGAWPKGKPKEATYESGYTGTPCYCDDCGITTGLRTAHEKIEDGAAYTECSLCGKDVFVCYVKDRIGLWAYKEEQEMYSQMERDFPFYRDTDTGLTGLFAIGTVALWGNIKEHTKGYRGQFGYPQKVWCRSEKPARYIRNAYGCETFGNYPEEVYEQAKKHKEEIERRK